MSLIGKYRRWRAMTWSERGLIAEAVTVLAIARLAAPSVPFRIIAKRLQNPAAAPRSAPTVAQAPHVRRAVLLAARQLPGTTPCLAQAIAAQTMLKRRHCASTLHLGVGKDAHGALTAHAWVEAAGEIVVGENGIAGMQPIAAFNGGFTPAPQHIADRKATHVPCGMREFEFAALCCVWPATAQSQDAIRAAASNIDWPQFLHVIQRHRIAGIVWRNLQLACVDVPGATGPALSHAAAVTARHGLLLAAEAGRMRKRLEQQGVAALMLKGAALGQRAYGDFTLRHSKDIDIVVAPEKVEAALAVIAAAGYRRIHPPATLVQPALWRRYVAARKECEFIDPVRGIQLELHWRLTDNPHLFPTPPQGSWQPVTLQNALSLMILSRDDLFFYLCVHGASHAWMRLKWPADIAALLADEDAAGIERLYRLAISRHIGPCVGSALLLCQALFGTVLPPALAAELARSRRNRWLCAIALRMLSGGAGTREVPDQRWGTTAITCSHFLFDHRWRYQLAALHGLLTYEADFLMLPLPPALTFLYPLLRLPLWLWRRVRHHGRSR